jgi:hypothetical protein
MVGDTDVDVVVLVVKRERERERELREQGMCVRLNTVTKLVAS